MAWLRWFGSSTFTVPNGVTKLKITAVGGSGAGGSVLADGSISSTAGQRLGGGGGGAGQVITTEVTVSGGQVLTIDIGNGARSTNQFELEGLIRKALNNTLDVTGFKAASGTDTLVKIGTTELVRALGGKSGYNDANGIDRIKYKAGTGGAGGGQSERPIRATWETADAASDIFRDQDGQIVYPSYTTFNNDGINLFPFDQPNVKFPLGSAGDAGGFLVTGTGTSQVFERHPRARFRLEKSGQAGDGASGLVPLDNTRYFQSGVNGGNGIVTIEWQDTITCVNPPDTTDSLGTYSTSNVVRTSRGLFCTFDLLKTTSVSQITTINSWYLEYLGRPGDKLGIKYWYDRVLAVGLDFTKNEFIVSAQIGLNSLGKVIDIFTMCQAQCVYTILPSKTISDDYAETYLENMVLVDSNGIARTATLVLTPRYNGPKDNNFGDTLISWYKEVFNRLPDAEGYRYWIDNFSPLSGSINFLTAKETFVTAAKPELEKHGRTTATYSYAESACLDLKYSNVVFSAKGTSTSTSTTTFPPSIFNYCYDVDCQLLQSSAVPNFLAQTKCNTSGGELRYTGYHGGSGEYEVAYHESPNTWFTTEEAARNPASVGGVWRTASCVNPENTYDNLAEYNVGRVLIYSDNFEKYDNILVATTKTAEAALVNGWYLSQVNRPADQIGLNFWVQSLIAAKISNTISQAAIFTNFSNSIKTSEIDLHGKVRTVMTFCSYQNLTSPYVNINKNGLANGTYFLAVRDTKNKSLVTSKSVTITCSGTATNFLPALRPPITLVDFTGVLANDTYVYTKAGENRKQIEDAYDAIKRGDFTGWEKLLLTNNNTAPLLYYTVSGFYIRSGVDYFVGVYDSSKLFGGLVVKRIKLTCQSNLTFDIKITSDVDLPCAYIVASNFRGGSGEYEVPANDIGYFITKESAQSNSLWRTYDSRSNLSQSVRIQSSAVAQCFYYIVRDKFTKETAIRSIGCGPDSICSDLDFEVDTYCNDTNCNTFRMLNFTGGSRRYEVPFGATKFFKTKAEAEIYNVFVEILEGSYTFSGSTAKPGYCYWFVLRDAITKQKIIKAYSCGATRAPNGCNNPSNFESWPQTSSTTTTVAPRTPSVITKELLLFEPKFVVLDHDMFAVDDITYKVFLDTQIPFKLKVSGTPPLTKFIILGTTPDGVFDYNETTNATGTHISPYIVINNSGIANFTLRLYESLYAIPPTTSTTTLRTFAPKVTPSKAFVNSQITISMTNGPDTGYSTAPVTYTKSSSPGPVSRMYSPGETLTGSFNLDGTGSGTVPMVFTKTGQAVITFAFASGSNYQISKNPLVHYIDVIDSTIQFDFKTPCSNINGREILITSKSGSSNNLYNVYSTFDTDINAVILSTDYVTVGPDDVVSRGGFNKGTYYVKVADATDPANAKILPISVTCDLIDFAIEVQCPEIQIKSMTGDERFRVYQPYFAGQIDLDKYVIVGPNDVISFPASNTTYLVTVANRDGTSTATKQVTVNCDPSIPKTTPTTASPTTASPTTAPPTTASPTTAAPVQTTVSTCPLYMAFCSFESFGTINVGSRDQFIDTGFGTFD